MQLQRPKSLKQLALEHLRNSIIDGTLKMGQTLSERGISDDLGVSKSPVREALAQLSDEGLVIIEPQKGARVFSLSESEVAQICDFRQVIEAASFELAIARNPVALASEMDNIVKDMTKAQKSGDIRGYLALDTEFHQAVFKHCGNDYLSASYSRYVGKIAALRTHLSSYPQHTELSFKEHQMLAAAVRKGDMTEVRKHLQDHIDRTRNTYSIAVKTTESSGPIPSRSA